MIVDVETGRISDVNPFLLELLGLSHAEMVGKTDRGTPPFKNIEANLAMLERLKHHGYGRYEDLLSEKGRIVHIAVEFVSTVYQDGDRAMIQCNIRDITERKQAEDEIRRLNAELSNGWPNAQNNWKPSVIPFHTICERPCGILGFRGVAATRGRTVPFRKKSSASENDLSIGKTDGSFNR